MYVGKGYYVSSRHQICYSVEWNKSFHLRARVDSGRAIWFSDVWEKTAPGHDPDKILETLSEDEYLLRVLQGTTDVDYCVQF